MITMFRINVILMLSTIIPDLDCCSSLTIFNRKSIHLYPNAGIELSLHKSTQFQQTHHNHHFLHQQQQTQPPSSLSPPPQFAFPEPQLPATLEHANVQTNSWHKYLHLDPNNNSEQSDVDYLKLNKSLKLDIQEQEEEQLEQKLFSNDQHEQVNSTTETTPTPNTKSTTTPTTLNSTSKTTTKLTTTEPQNQIEEDAQYKLISEIVSLECVDFLKLEFCLNGGRCFLYPILNHSLSSCECAEGFVGERCEAKSYEFIPRTRPRLVLAKTRGGPLIYGLAIVDILFLLFLFCKNYNRD